MVHLKAPVGELDRHARCPIGLIELVMDLAHHGHHLSLGHLGLGRASRIALSPVIERLTRHSRCDHGRLKARLRPMRGLKIDRGASVVISGHASIQNLRRGHYELGAEARTCHLGVAVAFDELAAVI